MTEHAQEKKAALLTDQSAIDLTTVGIHDLTFTHGKKQETVRLTVEDTTAPMLKLRDVSADIGTELSPTDFVSEVVDLSQVRLTFAKALETPEGYGDVTVEIIATDESGNETRKTCTLSYVWMRNEATLELGGSLSKGDILMNPEKDGDLLDQAVLDALTTAAVGVYPITVTTVDGQTGTCQVTVVDTVKPELKVKNPTVYEGEADSLDDFVESASDLAGPVTTKLQQTPDTGKAGTYTVTVEASDINGNVTTAEATLQVVKDTDPPVFSGLKKLSVNGTDSNPQSGTVYCSQRRNIIRDFTLTNARPHLPQDVF